MTPPGTNPPNSAPGETALSRTERLVAASSRAFSETSDPAAYVPREATESLLESLRVWGESDEAGSTVGAVIGSPGLGKTLILRVTEARMNGARRSGIAAPTSAGVRSLYVPYGGLELPDFAVWVYGLLGRTRKEGAVAPTFEQAIGALLGLGKGPQDPFYLLIDDADSISGETVRALNEYLPAKASPLRVLLALNPDSKGTRLMTQFHALEPTDMSLRDRMSIEETKTYLVARMRWAGFSEAEIGQLSDDWIHQVHSLSLGVPRALHGLAARSFDDRIRGVVSDLEDKRRREDWMGSPMEGKLEI